MVMAPGSHTYLDKYQSPDVLAEPIAIGGHLPLDTVYAFEAVPAGQSPDQLRPVLGAQAQRWTEYLATQRDVENTAFPRLAALAEVVWTPAGRRDRDDFDRRLAAGLARLHALDVNFRPPDGPPRPWRARAPAPPPATGAPTHPAPRAGGQ